MYLYVFCAAQRLFAPADAINEIILKSENDVSIKLIAFLHCNKFMSIKVSSTTFTHIQRLRFVLKLIS